ncbi:restriction endonuclease [Pantoea agglomerans]|uniref:restriction endonuclease n=1 Tax=Enterobacter agglomerans TaxID=549 RepID=UPI001F30B0F8|nr:restriction endonuclease [Pantoea agglomerans]UJL39262.1 restriction endonuclease [Pantoea agglomerans]
MSKNTDWKMLEEQVQQVYSQLLNMKDEGVMVSRNVCFTGRSGANHQIDVYYEFIKAGVRHKVMIECKHKGRAVEKEDVASFSFKISDIGGVSGVMISKSGYQKGARQVGESYGITLLTETDLPALNEIIAQRLMTVALPDESYVGEPFWTIMKIREGKNTGSYYCGFIDKLKKHYIPLFYSKYHAELAMSKADLDSKQWGVRGLPRYALRSFIIQLELFEKRDTVAMIMLLPPGARNDAEFVSMVTSRAHLMTEYYGADIPAVDPDLIK